MQQFLLRLNQADQIGQGLVEYALILVLISVAAIVIMGVFGAELGEVYNEITNTLASA